MTQSNSKSIIFIMSYLLSLNKNNWAFIQIIQFLYHVMISSAVGSNSNFIVIAWNLPWSNFIRNQHFISIKTNESYDTGKLLISLLSYFCLLIKRTFLLEYLYYVILFFMLMTRDVWIEITILVMKSNFNPFLWQCTKNCDLRNQNIHHKN